MSKDTDTDTMTDADGTQYSYDNIKTQGWLNGHVPGVEMAAKLVDEKAAELFMRDKFGDAEALKRLANEIRNQLIPKCILEASQHRNDHPDVIQRKGKP